MARRKKVYDDDDGRTIADMSGIERQRLVIPRGVSRADEPAPPAEEEEQPRRPWEEEPITRPQRRMYVLGALKAALLIGGAFLVGIGLFIALLLWIWL